mmetsp:Transcript_21585/g.53241  ORF Transcript_21585/g.53241 Transcript_21585/m.53241 type:complete len:176 (+) Transcript_21585:482-1009(+)
MGLDLMSPRVPREHLPLFLNDFFPVLHAYEALLSKRFKRKCIAPTGSSNLCAESRAPGLDDINAAVLLPDRMEDMEMSRQRFVFGLLGLLPPHTSGTEVMFPGGESGASEPYMCFRGCYFLWFSTARNRILEPLCVKILVALFLSNFLCELLNLKKKFGQCLLKESRRRFLMWAA